MDALWDQHRFPTTQTLISSKRNWTEPILQVDQKRAIQVHVRLPKNRPINKFINLEEHNNIGDLSIHTCSLSLSVSLCHIKTGRDFEIFASFLSNEVKLDWTSTRLVLVSFVLLFFCCSSPFPNWCCFGVSSWGFCDVRLPVIVVLACGIMGIGDIGLFGIDWPMSVAIFGDLGDVSNDSCFW